MKIIFKMFNLILLVIDILKNRDLIKPLDENAQGLNKKLYYRSSATDVSLLHFIHKYINCTGKKILDIGCGKGNAIRFLKFFNFKQIDGVELSKEAFEICKKNFISKRISIYNIDILLLENINDYDYLYMYNPFSKEIMEKFLKKGINKPIIYRNPIYHDTLVKNNYKLIFSKQYYFDWQTINYYEKCLKEI